MTWCRWVMWSVYIGVCLCMFMIKRTAWCGGKSVDSGSRLPGFASSHCHHLGRYPLYLSVFVCKITMILVPIDDDVSTDPIIQPLRTRGVNTLKHLQQSLEEDRSSVSSLSLSSTSQTVCPSRAGPVSVTLTAISLLRRLMSARSGYIMTCD